MYNTSNCPFFESFSRKKLSLLCAFWAGILFFAGWWFMIDITVVYPELIRQKKCYYLPGIFGTVALIVVNVVPNRVAYGAYYTDRKWCGTFMSRLYLFVGFVIAFGSLIGASFILVNDFMLCPWTSQWPGYGLFLQNFMIFSANMLLKFGVNSVEF